MALPMSTWLCSSTCSSAGRFGRFPTKLTITMCVHAPWASHNARIASWKDCCLAIAEAPCPCAVTASWCMPYMLSACPLPVPEIAIAAVAAPMATMPVSSSVNRRAELELLVMPSSLNEDDSRRPVLGLTAVSDAQSRVLTHGLCKICRMDVPRAHEDDVLSQPTRAKIFGALSDARRAV